jgi:hypothetical protein
MQKQSYQQHCFKLGAKWFETLISRRNVWA